MNSSNKNIVDMRIADLVTTVDGALPIEFCNQLIGGFNHEMAIRSANANGDIADAGIESVRRIDNEMCQFESLNCNKVPGWEHVASYVAGVARHWADKYFTDLGVRGLIPSVDRFEQVRMKCYEPGDQFDWHVDVADAESSRRFLVCLFYLNYCHGGETVFGSDAISDKLGVSPEPGRLVMFPPMWMLPHKGMPALNRKYTIATFIHYEERGHGAQN